LFIANEKTISNVEESFSYKEEMHGVDVYFTRSIEFV
jgi:hypothetical protein